MNEVLIKVFVKSVQIVPLQTVATPRRVAVAPISEATLTDIDINASTDRSIRSQHRKSIAKSHSTMKGMADRIDWKRVVSIADRVFFGVSVTAFVITVGVLFPR